MQHKLLLGSTALVGAGILMSGAAQAQETTVGGMQVQLGGYTEFGGKVGQSLDPGPDRGYFFYMDNEVFINANGATDRGLQYGSKIELEVGSGNGNTEDATIDEVALFFSSGWGRIELGREDGAENVMGVGGADAQAGTGGIDGDTQNLVQFEALNTGDDAKVSYFTPRVVGFQLGGSFVPDTGNGINDSAAAQAADGFPGPDFENVVGAGVNWVGALGPADLTVAGEGVVGSAIGPGDDLQSWDAGFLAGFGGFSLGAGVGMNNDFAESEFATVGLKYGFGAANVSAGYVFNDPDNGDSTNLIAVSGDIGLLQGVTLKGDVVYNEECTCANNGVNPDEAVQGVVTVQLDY
jgi:outer membrane protein OmpU